MDSRVDTRARWLEHTLAIAGPVFSALAEGQLRALMPVEIHPDADVAERVQYSHLEAVGRSLAGIAPWLALDPALLSASEAMAQAEMLALLERGLAHAVDPQSVDFLNFSYGGQPIVDAAFLAQGLLRCWDTLWPRLQARTQAQLIECMLLTRSRLPCYNNWLLFAAMIECFLYKAGADWDRMRIDYALRQHQQWYLGDGAYGDGPDFHWDYYNSFVIQPMLYDIMQVGGEISRLWQAFAPTISQRLQRYAAVQERMVAPDGSFPPIGRSLAYRFGAFQALAQAALKQLLPPEIDPAAARCALTAVIEKMLSPRNTFDDNGWLRIGVCGHQPQIAESYISTGSLYLCLCGMLPLGLPANDPFWSNPDQAWTSKRIWSGEDFPADHALSE